MLAASYAVLRGAPGAWLQRWNEACEEPAGQDWWERTDATCP